MSNDEEATHALDLALTEGSPYQVLVLDMLISQNDSRRVAARVRSRALSDTSLEPPHILGLTAQGVVKSGIDMELLGMNSHLNKPIDPSSLYNALLQCMQSSREDKQASLSFDDSSLPQFGARVLVVEDNLANQKVAQFILEDFGLVVEFALNGKEAVDALRSYSYDLVFMDCQMPVLDGYQATALIRSLDSKVKNSKVPIIAMTANVLQEDRDRCFEVGMDDFVGKPVVVEAVENVLRCWIPNFELDSIDNNDNQDE